MDSFYIYLFKSALSLVLFYAFYRLVVFQNTYFKVRRITLLAILFFSIVYPLIDIADWLISKEPVYEMVSPYILTDDILLQELPVMEVQEQPRWSLRNIGVIVYLTGVILLLIRMLVQIGSIIRLRYKSERIYIGNCPVQLLPGVETPFSFFSWIFMDPSLYGIQERDQILTHERTHCNQYHSVDVLISELTVVFFWFNPFVWLIKQEIRVNLEHLADEQVLESGTEPTTYQYSLLRLCHHVTSNKLVNNFNIPQFKRRIIMMNKDKSNKNSLLRYVLLVPVAGLLIISGNVQAVVTKVKAELVKIPDAQSVEVQKISGSVRDAAGNPVQGVNIVVKNGTVGTISDKNGRFVLETEPQNSIVFSFVGLETVDVNLADYKGKAVDIVMQDKSIENPEIVVVGYGQQKVIQSEKKGTNPGDEVFTVVEDMPEYPGGTNALLEFISKNVRYPEEARKNNIEGRVILSFIVNKEGRVVDPQVVRGVSPELDQEALRVIGQMGKWTPGKQRGVPVNVKYTLPISFRNQKSLPASQPKTSTENTQTAPAPVSASTTSADKENLIFTVVEDMPKFPGGENEMMRFIAKNIKYPVIAQENGIQGRVIVQYVVTKTGKIQDVAVVRGVDPSLDAEAVRVIKSMPDWIPGKQRGVPVNVKYTSLVTFRLQAPENQDSGTSIRLRTSDPNQKAQNPLIVIDGKQQSVGFDIKQVDPEIIESISILKNEEAIRKYGEEAKDGVIIIVTKNGKA